LARFIALLLTVLLSLPAVSAQESTPDWTMTSVQSLGDLIGEDYEAGSQPILAPDGSAVAWGEPDAGLKVYSFADQQVTTYPWPENFRGFGRFSSPAWSPDGQYLAFTESVFDFFLEGDLWLLDRAAGTITNRTDDGVYGGWLDVDQPFAIDYLPTWNPANGDLYFFRTVQPEDGDYTTELHLMPVGRDEPKLVRDLSADLSMVFSVYRPAVISQDGDTLAFIVLGSDLEDANNGLWILDLQTGTPEQVTSLADLRTGLPPEQDESALFPETLLWAGYDALVVLSRDVQFATQIGQMAYYVDLGTGEVTPITDFTDVVDIADIFVADDPESPVYRIPRSGVVSPEGSTFLFLRHGVNQERAGISAVSLPPDGSPPVELGEIEGFEITPAASAPPTVSADGKAVMYGYLFQFEES